MLLWSSIIISSLSVASALNIAILAVGTYGDAAPFIPIALGLQHDGHRVRFATHEKFRKLVESNGIEFRPLQGDADVFQEMALKSRGQIIPLHSLTSARSMFTGIRKVVRDIVMSIWPVVHDPEDNFIADAIISNPLTYGHIHVAEKLQIPLHIMFPQPWVPTRAYPHPMSGLSYQRHWSRVNYYSYRSVEASIWLGIADIVNELRRDQLQLPEISRSYLFCASRFLETTPHVFLYSPILAPKPQDWGERMDVVGAATVPFDIEAERDTTWLKDFPKLEAFLSRNMGRKIIYVGFGSTMVGNPTALADTIAQAAIDAEVSIILQSGWAKLVPTIETHNVFLLDRAPHSKLFQQVTAVVHHGGAGTTAMGIMSEKPTLIIPFLGEMPFWGERIHQNDLGPAPIPFQKLTSERLAIALQDLATNPLYQETCERLGKQMVEETGTENAIEAFYRQYQQAPRINPLLPVQRGNVQHQTSC